MSEIAALERVSKLRGLWGAFPGYTPWEVALKNGQTMRFQTDNFADWIADLGKAIQRS